MFRFWACGINRGEQSMDDFRRWLVLILQAVIVFGFISGIYYVWWKHGFLWAVLIFFFGGPLVGGGAFVALNFLLPKEDRS